MKFLVDSIDPLGWISGISVGSEDIPVGSTFTEITKTQYAGCSPNLTSIDLGVVASIRLTLQEVEWYRRNIQVIPSGHSARILVAGEGIDSLISSLKDQQARERVFIACHV